MSKKRSCVTLFSQKLEVKTEEPKAVICRFYTDLEVLQ